MIYILQPRTIQHGLPAGYHGGRQVTLYINTHPSNIHTIASYYAGEECSQKTIPAFEMSKMYSDTTTFPVINFWDSNDYCRFGHIDDRASTWPQTSRMQRYVFLRSRLT